MIENPCEPPSTLVPLIKWNEFFFMCLGALFNNKAVSSNALSTDAEMWVPGTGYPAQELPHSNEIVWLQDTPILFPAKTRTKDNWVLERRLLTFTPERIDEIHLLCAGSGGSYFEEVAIQFEDGQLETFDVYFCDWRDQEPMEGYKARIQCSYHHYSGQDDPRPTNMWLQTVSLRAKGKISGLQFNDNPFAHVFAMTLHLGC